MGQLLSDLNIPLSNLAKGTHICYFYSGTDDLADVVVQYFRTGAAQNERCLWVCSKAMNAQSAADFLARDPDMAGLLETGQLAVVEDVKFYLDKEGKVDIPGILERWSAEISRTFDAGFDGLRVAGEWSFLDLRCPEWSRLIRAYEDRFCAFAMKAPVTALCCYPMDRVDLTDILDIAYAHHFVAVRKDSTVRLVPAARHRDVLWHSLLDTLTRGMLLLDTSGAVITASQALLDLFGCRNPPDLGSDLREFATRFRVTSITGRVPPHSFDAASSCDIDDYWQASSPVYGDLELLVNIKAAKPGTIMPGACLIIFHDITGLRTVDTIAGNYLQVVSHELRNPIQTMTALVELMKGLVEDRETPMYRYIRMAESCLSRITGILDELMLRRQDSPVIRPKATDLTALLTEALEPYLANPKHEFICRFDKQRPVPATVDPVRIHQILANVLDNAVKYTPQGKRIWLDLEVADSRAVITVEDEGVGIPMSEVERVFEQFYRGSRTRDKFSGAGLGLYVSRCLARMHGGDLWAEARPEGGTAIKLSLPVLCGSVKNLQEGND